MNLNFFTYPKGISINVQFNKHKGENPGTRLEKEQILVIDISMATHNQMTLIFYET